MDGVEQGALIQYMRSMVDYDDPSKTTICKARAAIAAAESVKSRLAFRRISDDDETNTNIIAETYQVVLAATTAAAEGKTAAEAANAAINRMELDANAMALKRTGLDMTIMASAAATVVYTTVANNGGSKEMATSSYNDVYLNVKSTYSTHAAALMFSKLTVPIVRSASNEINQFVNTVAQSAKSVAGTSVGKLWSGGKSPASVGASAAALAAITMLGAYETIDTAMLAGEAAGEAAANAAHDGASDEIAAAAGVAAAAVGSCKTMKHSCNASVSSIESQSPPIEIVSSTYKCILDGNAVGSVNSANSDVAKDTCNFQIKSCKAAYEDSGGDGCTVLF